jgi:hypothetical protein
MDSAGLGAHTRCRRSLGAHYCLPSLPRPQVLPSIGSRLPSLVVSGINNGANLGGDILVSGTMRHPSSPSRCLSTPAVPLAAPLTPAVPLAASTHQDSLSLPLHPSSPSRCRDSCLPWPPRPLPLPPPRHCVGRHVRVHALQHPLHRRVGGVCLGHIPARGAPAWSGECLAAVHVVVALNALYGLCSFLLEHSSARGATVNCRACTARVCGAGQGGAAL